MPDHEYFLLPLARILPGSLPAYAGPGPGLELIPYFLGLLTWAGMAFGAVILWPVSKLLRRLCKGRCKDQAETPHGPEIASAKPGEESAMRPMEYVESRQREPRS